MSLKPAMFLVLALVPAPALAQDAAAREVTAFFYGYFPDTRLEIGTPEGTVEGEIPIGDALETLDFALMGAVEVQQGRFGVIGDLLYFESSDDADGPEGLGLDEAELENKSLVASGYLTYNVLDGGANRIDLGLGARFYRVENDVELIGPAGGSASASTDDDWADALVAVRYRGQFGERLFGSAILDAGFGGSDSSVQAIASIGYQITERASLQVGYRHLQFDRGDIDVTMTGPIAGLAYRF